MCRCGASEAGLPGEGTGWKGMPARAGEAGDRQTAVADEVIGRRDALPGERRADGRRSWTCGRTASKVGAFPVAGDEDGNVVLIGARMAGLAPPLCVARAAGRTNGP